MEIVKVSQLKKDFSLDGVSFPALRGVDVVIHQQEVCALVGKSGSGKTTLLNQIGLLDRPDSGEISIFGSRVSDLNDDEMSEIRAKKIGFVFQTFNLIPVLTALENVEYALMLLKQDKGQFKKNATEALEKVGLKDHLHKLPSQLSGGQRQRVSIARAIVKNPALILADEPTANLDSENSLAILDLLFDLQRNMKTSVVLCSHDTEIVKRISKVYRLKDGLIEGV